MLAYASVSTQWRVGGEGMRIGLDYNAMIATLNILEFEVKKALVEKIQVLETAILKCDAHRREQAQQ